MVAEGGIIISLEVEEAWEEEGAKVEEEETRATQMSRKPLTWTWVIPSSLRRERGSLARMELRSVHLARDMLLRKYC